MGCGPRILALTAGGLRQAPLFGTTTAQRETGSADAGDGVESFVVEAIAVEVIAPHCS